MTRLYTKPVANCRECPNLGISSVEFWCKGTQMPEPIADTTLDIVPAFCPLKPVIDLGGMSQDELLEAQSQINDLAKSNPVAAAAQAYCPECGGNLGEFQAAHEPGCSVGMHEAEGMRNIAMDAAQKDYLGIYVPAEGGDDAVDAIRYLGEPDENDDLTRSAPAIDLYEMWQDLMAFIQRVWRWLRRKDAK